MKTIIATLAASLLFLGGAIATEKTEVKPGNAPTETMDQAVPAMKDCADTQAQAKSQEQPPTKAVGEAVPEMKSADAGTATKNCPDKAASGG